MTFINKSKEIFDKLGDNTNNINQDWLQAYLDGTNSDNQKQYLSRYQLKDDEKLELIKKWLEKEKLEIPSKILFNTIEWFHYLLTIDVFPKYLKLVKLFKSYNNLFVNFFFKYLMNNIICSLNSLDKLVEYLHDNNSLSGKEESKSKELEILKKELKGQENILEKKPELIKDDSPTKLSDDKKKKNKSDEIIMSLQKQVTSLQGRSFSENKFSESLQETVVSLREKNKILEKGYLQLDEKFVSVQKELKNLKKENESLQNELNNVKEKCISLEKLLNDNNEKMKKELNERMNALLADYFEEKKSEKANVPEKK